MWVGEGETCETYIQNSKNKLTEQTKKNTWQVGAFRNNKQPCLNHTVETKQPVILACHLADTYPSLRQTIPGKYGFNQPGRTLKNKTSCEAKMLL